MGFTNSVARGRVLDVCLFVCGDVGEEWVVGLTRIWKDGVVSV